jgi:ATP-dependent Clp protease ATP-binding subunit ClpC
LLRAGLDQADILQEVERTMGRGDPGLRLPQGLTPRAQHIFALAAADARGTGGEIGAEHLLMAIVREEGCTAARMLQAADADCGTRVFSDAYSELQRRSSCSARKERTQTKLLDQFGTDLLERVDQMDPVIGREREIELVIQVLSRRQKNNPVLIGEPGVGKTAIAEGLAQRMAAGEVPEQLRGKRLIALDMATMVAGTKYRGEFEQRVQELLGEITRLGNIILFLDELHTLVGAGSAEGAIDAANILKPALGRGQLQLLGATTTEEYRKHVEKDAALDRRFRTILVEEPTREQTAQILRGLRPSLEAHHGIVIADDAISASIDLSCRYLSGRFLPDKAIDLLDEGAARAKLTLLHCADRGLEQTRQSLSQRLDAAVRDSRYEAAAELRDKLQTVVKRQNHSRAHRRVCAEDIAGAVSDRTGIPVERLTADEKTRLLALEQTLRRSVIGQDAAVETVARAVRRSRSGMADPDRPLGVFLFAGPTGVGKTELCRALAESVYGSREALVKLDMSEYMEQHAVSRLLGAPPGYVGHGEGGELTEVVRKRPYSLILLDELEKAHRDVTGILLQVFEDGVLTDSMGRKADFRNAMIVMTTNLGAEEAAGQGLGFVPQQSRSRVLDCLREAFRPELLGRIDATAVFDPLDEPTLRRIAGKLLGQSLLRAQRVGVEVTACDDALDLIVRQGSKQGGGARGLRRVIRTLVEEPLADALLRGTIPPKVQMRAAGDSIEFVP